MAGITLAQAEARLELYLAAETKVLAGQKVEIDGEALTRANLEAIQKGIDRWDSKVKELSARASGTSRSRRMSAAW